MLVLNLTSQTSNLPWKNLNKHFDMTFGFKEISAQLCQKRYLIVFLAFLGYINLYTMRVNLSVAIVAMTDKSSQDNSTSEVIFDWDQKQKGVILGAFFYGYILTQLMGGYTATKFGGNIVSNFYQPAIKLKVIWKSKFRFLEVD